MQTGRNTLHIACVQGCNESVKILLESGKIKDINDKTNVKSSFSSHLQDNRDVLSLAISGNCSVYTIALLILHGAATNCVDDVHFNSSLLLYRNVVVYYIKLF